MASNAGGYTYISDAEKYASSNSIKAAIFDVDSSDSKLGKFLVRYSTITNSNSATMELTVLEDLSAELIPTPTNEHAITYYTEYNYSVGSIKLAGDQKGCNYNFRSFSENKTIPPYYMMKLNISFQNTEDQNWYAVSIFVLDNESISNIDEYMSRIGMTAYAGTCYIFSQEKIELISPK